MTWKSTGPLSYQGGTARAAQPEAVAKRLHVHPQHDANDLTTSGALALMNSEDFRAFAEYLCGAPAFLQLVPSSDCMVPVRGSSEIPAGSVHMDAVARHNLHVVHGETYSFTVWEGPECPDLLDLQEVHLEVNVLGQAYQPSKADRAAQDSTTQATLTVEADAPGIIQGLLRSHTHRMLSLNQIATVTMGEHTFVARVTQTDVLRRPERAGKIGYHCFRGRLHPGTEIYLSASNATNGTAVSLRNAPKIPSEDSPDPAVVDVLTEDGESGDGEHFPVQKAVLRPCIALTSAVRAKERSSARVSIDTLTFDRVLMFLEAVALGRDPPNFGVHLLSDLRAAAERLQCQSLVAFCDGKLGSLEARIKLHSFQDVVDANHQGKVWLIIDGMVLDVTHWLAEHPGGKTIIPAQGLNLDCVRMFELYHSSRESFLYLAEFYIGEILAADRDKVPLPEAPSEDFMSQLQSFTTWRIPNQEERAFKSF